MLVVVFNLRPRPRFEVLRGIVRGCELIAAIGPLTEPPSPVRQAVAFFVATVAGITFTERFEEHALIISLTLVVHVLAIVFVAAPEGVARLEEFHPDVPVVTAVSSVDAMLAAASVVCTPAGDVVSSSYPARDTRTSNTTM